MNRKLAFLPVIALAVLHQDWWWWDTPHPLVFGFLPIGLAYHALFSIMASAAWALVLYYAWPSHHEEFANAKDSSNPS